MIHRLGPDLHLRLHNVERLRGKGRECASGCGRKRIHARGERERDANNRRVRG